MIRSYRHEHSQYGSQTLKGTTSNTDHVGAPAELASDQDTRRVSDAVRDDNFLDLVIEGIFDGLAEILKLFGFRLALSLLFLGLLKLKALLRHADELLALELLELRDGILVDGVDQEEDLEAFPLETLKEGRVLHRLERLASKVVDVLLDLGHASNIVWECR
jgi:hypothetical protein